jgi:hypothetical protein
MLRLLLISPCLHVTASTKTSSAVQAKISVFVTQRVSSSASSEKVSLYRYSSQLSAWKASLTLCTDTSPTLTFLPFRIGSVSAAPKRFGTNADEECSQKQLAQVTRTTRHHVCRRTLSRCNALFRHHHEIEQNDKICQITRGSLATANRCHEQITVPTNAMTTAHLIRNKCIEFEDDNEKHIHFCEQLKEALRATQAARSASASQTRTAPTVRTSHS